MSVPVTVSTQDSSPSLPRARDLRTVWPSQTWLVRTQQPKKAVRRRFAIALPLPVLCANMGRLSAGTCPRPRDNDPVAPQLLLHPESPGSARVRNVRLVPEAIELAWTESRNKIADHLRPQNKTHASYSSAAR